MRVRNGRDRSLQILRKPTTMPNKVSQRKRNGISESLEITDSYVKIKTVLQLKFQCANWTGTFIYTKYLLKVKALDTSNTKRSWHERKKRPGKCLSQCSDGQ